MVAVISFDKFCGSYADWAQRSLPQLLQSTKHHHISYDMATIIDFLHSPDLMKVLLRS